MVTRIECFKLSDRIWSYKNIKLHRRGISASARSELLCGVETTVRRSEILMLEIEFSCWNMVDHVRKIMQGLL